MKKLRWRQLISLMVSFAIVFNITVVPAFAEGEDAAEAPAQEEAAAEQQAEGEAAQTEEASELETSDAPEAPAETGSAADEKKQEEHAGGEGKYVQDVYIAYARTEEEARKWLRENGWEPLTGNADFNAGKASFFDNNKLQNQNVAAVMGIRRTDKAYEAITDMAVMNMKGGYSFPEYEALVEEKKTEINEFIGTFIPVLEEYRKNFAGKGSAVGKKRAELAHDMLNKFYDGKQSDPYAVNDTGKLLGDLFLDKVMQEGNKNGGDLQQIILESSSASVTTIETCLALAADAGETTWLERLQELSGDELAENLGKYVPEAEGQDVAPSAVKKFLRQRFGDQAQILAGQWDSIHEKMLSFEDFNEKNGLWKDDKESDKEYEARLDKFFSKMEKEAGDEMTAEQKDYIRSAQIYTGLYEIAYEGEWGDTLGDFFNPAENSSYAEDVNSFLPMAAALSRGQRSALGLVNLEVLLLVGMGTEDSVNDVFKDAGDLMGSAEAISVYSGINRGMFRGGVALTNAALMEKNQSGYDPFTDMWSINGIYNISTYAAAITGIIVMGIGFGISRSVSGPLGELSYKIGVAQRGLTRNQNLYKSTVSVNDYLLGKYKGDYTQILGNGTNANDQGRIAGELQDYLKKIDKYKTDLKNLNKEAAPLQKVSSTGRMIMGIGGALLIAAAAAKGYQMYRYYHTTFTQIPVHIVDESDIVSYEKDDEGNETRLIDFDQYVYYETVRCNRQEVGEIGEWQSGVSDYQSWGCGDAADLNADIGQQWLAMYKVRSEKKGFPVLADSLTLQYGSAEMPKGCTRALHMFTYENAMDLGDTAYAYNNDKGGVYFFWDADEEAYAASEPASDAASTFAGGSTAIAGGLGLLVGIIGTLLVTRKKREEA